MSVTTSKDKSSKQTKSALTYTVAERITTVEKK